MKGGPPTAGEIRHTLATILDPEVGLDIVTLGLVYDVTVHQGNVTVTFTLTNPGCPLRAVMTESIRAAVYALPGVDHVHTNLVWEPRWHPGMMEI